MMTVNFVGVITNQTKVTEFTVKVCIHCDLIANKILIQLQAATVYTSTQNEKMV